MIHGPYILKAARGLLGWTQEGLAKEAGVAVNTIRRLESVTDWEKTWQSPSVGTLNKIQTAFEKHDLEFLNEDGVGVRIRK
ncbi:helix-turn-helix domain-containing protein [Paremcibacter congregatus]|uniref:helix-turn-helix domain-containing protein n=1 Tax=Paremcibacter congregatus TaxID=2043170 RepID=UPI003A8D8813